MRLKPLGQAALLFSSRLLVRFTALLTLLVVARALDSHEFGFYAYSALVALFLSSVGHLGMRQAGARSLGQQAASRAQIEQASLISWVLSSLASLAIATLLLWPYEDISPVSKGLAVAMLLPMLFVNIYQGMNLGEGKVEQLAWADLIGRIIPLALLAPMALLDDVTLEFALGATFGGQLAAAAYVGWTLRLGAAGRAPLELAGFWRLQRTGMKYILPYSLYMGNGLLVAHLVNTLSSLADAGRYFGVSKLCEIFSEIAVAVGTTLFSQGVRESGRAEDLASALGMIRFSVFLFICISVVLAVGAEPVVYLMLGSDFLPAVGALRILMIGAPFGALARMLQMYLASQGQPLAGTAVLGPSIVVQGVLCWLLIPEYGLIGAAAATVIVQAAGAVGILILFCRRFKTSPIDVLLIRPRELWSILRNLSLKIVRRQRKLHVA
ncbi:polysaccharide biosynthesis C-terminal domain-containing protein [Skermanella rosea]|uniref:polysaccharide biosynthesis C-terminal domain-containing protein n=1 Tax=Skermanella rosea TaxID=1817965 RepID=UPI0019331F55|nr:polysaccharide biosynthesis C-terminal domain-containing protein [Skermanella rosea]UEM05095.1 polysaccharide biosynthesis C-terminal domain-containing protein [Skermanella rosea]